jgi:hypothetical protein
VIRFHLDESADGRLAAALRRRGIEVSTPSDAGLLGAADEQQLDFAAKENRVLIAQDSDFLELHFSGVAHAGIAYCSPGRRSLGELVSFLCLMHDCMTEAEMQGRLQYL